MDFNFENAYQQRYGTLPVFLRHRGIQGVLRVAKKAGQRFEKVKLVLMGSITNSIGHRCETYERPYKLVVEQNILQLVDVHNATAPQHSACTEFFPFHFTFHNEPFGEVQDPRRWSALSTLKEDIPRTLPSALDLSTCSGTWCHYAKPRAYGAETARCAASTRVKYELLAYAYENDEVVLRIQHEVRIYDTADFNPPPIHITDYPDEYTNTQEKRLQKFWSRSGRRLTIAATEPRPLQIRQGVRVHLAAIPLRFALRKDPKRPRATPGTLSVRISSLLKAMTFISMGEMTTHPTVGLTKHSPYLAMVQRFGRTYDRKLKVRDAEWKSITLNESGSKPESVWMCDTVVYLPICEQSCLAPTFFSAYLSRRYSLSLHMEAKSSDGKGTFHLNIPLQIVYPTDFGMDCPNYETATRPPTPSSDGGDDVSEVVSIRDVDRLPLYVR